ncbi:GntR family transcriptional regulator [Terasakiella sp.]|uniref:GntR family transcriptional regulator n=1 Tax=Terasakiella sp. TaxID=2034861 RepID=UPI003AA9AF9B
MSVKRSNELMKQIEHEILTGKLQPGTRLDEKSLTERFNVSRTPVREALHQLSSIGLIEILPRRGATVRKIGLRELIEMFEVMAELEGFCGSLAAQRMTNDEIKTLRERHLDTQKLVEAGEYDAYYDANVLFHECIYQGAHNNFLAQQTLNLRNRVAPYRRIQLRHPNRLQTSFAEHEEILNTIEKRDSAKASELLKAHVTVQQGSFNSFISSLPMDLLSDAG